MRKGIAFTSLAVAGVLLLLNQNVHAIALNTITQSKPSVITAKAAYRAGWKQIGGKWYYYNANGTKKTGWIMDKGKWYYLKSDGSMAVGWVQSGGKWYYLNKDGSMAVDTIIEDYKVGTDGARLAAEEPQPPLLKNEKLDNKFLAKIKSGNLVTNYNIDTVINDINILGLNTLNIPVVINVDSLSASDMSIDNYSKLQAITLIKKMQGRNINIILEPYPWIDNGSKSETNWLPANIDSFFSNWKTKVIKPLIDDIAVPYKVEALYIGSNFAEIEGNEEKFCEVVDYVKRYYKGLVTYRTNWWVTVGPDAPFSNLERERLKLAYEKKLNNKLFSKLDFISIAAYFELTGNATNTVDNLVKAIESTQIYDRRQNIKQEIKNFSTKWNKPVFFGELGFPPRDKASGQPYNPYITNKINAKEQANCFEAYKRVFENEPWHLGFSVFAIGSRRSDNNYYPSADSIKIIKRWYSK